MVLERSHQNTERPTARSLAETPCKHELCLRILVHRALWFINSLKLKQDLMPVENLRSKGSGSARTDALVGDYRVKEEHTHADLCTRTLRFNAADLNSAEPAWVRRVSSPFWICQSVRLFIGACVSVSVSERRVMILTPVILISTFPTAQRLGRRLRPSLARHGHDRRAHFVHIPSC